MATGSSGVIYVFFIHFVISNIYQYILVCTLAIYLLKEQVKNGWLAG